MVLAEQSSSDAINSDISLQSRTSEPIQVFRLPCKPPSSDEFLIAWIVLKREAVDLELLHSVSRTVAGHFAALRKSNLIGVELVPCLRLPDGECEKIVRVSIASQAVEEFRGLGIDSLRPTSATDPRIGLNFVSPLDGVYCTWYLTFPLLDSPVHGKLSTWYDAITSGLS